MGRRLPFGILILIFFALPWITACTAAKGDKSAGTQREEEKARPAIEKFYDWKDVFQALPKDFTGRPDWVRAIKEGIIEPRTRLDDASSSPALVEGDLTSEFKIEIIPPAASFYKVIFSHSSHSLWLNCSSCHPGIVRERGSGMQKIFAGEYCGRCHGKVSFAPLTACARCHVNLQALSEEAIDADLVKGGKNNILSSPDIIERGKILYLQACAVCHGEKGDGKGSLAAGLNPKPRDFTVGKFKFRSTPSNSLPTDFDLFRTITRGIQGTSMPGFSSLSYEDRFSIVHFIKTFSDKFMKEKPAAPIKISDPPPLTDKLLEIGKTFYRDAECDKCHGQTGRGDGPSSADLKDDWGEAIRPFDFTTGRPKAGSSLTDYYRDMMTGLTGTPMPDFGDVFEPEQAWGVIHYIYSLGGESRNMPSAVKGDFYFNRKAGKGETPPAKFSHWFHRVRVRCMVCHPGIFEMKAGANPITMDSIRDGKFCGKCHPVFPANDKPLAWLTSFETCARCHRVGN